MELKDYKTGELVIELLHREDIEVIFLEKNDSVRIDTRDVKGYNNKIINVEGAAIILIDRN